MEEEQAHIKIPFAHVFFRAAAAVVFSVAGWAGFASVAAAATLYLAPASGNYKVGQTFNVGVYVASADQAVNAYSGTVEFPEDILQITGVNKAGITSLWVQEPSYSNGRGTANFEGVVLNPGFTGSSGKIITLTFKAVKAGSAPVRLSEAVVLANDGQGTNILTGMGQTTYTVTEGAAPAPTPVPTPQEPAEPPRGVPGVPGVRSSTHPDPNVWYSNNNPAFSWSLPSGVTGVNVLADREEKRDPGTRSDGVFSKYDYKDVDDGTWYFHIKLQNANGWGSAAHFRFRVDTAAPTALEVREENSSKLFLKAADALSGMERYEVSVDGQAPLKVSATAEETPVILPILAAGEHVVSVRAVDHAGNISAETALKIRVAALEPPRLTDVPDVVYVDELLRGAGQTVPNGVVTLHVERAGEDPYTFEVTADAEGRFTFVAAKRLSTGSYFLSAKVAASAGQESAWAAGLTFRVRERLASSWILFLLLAILLSLLCLILIGDRRKEKKEGNKLVRKLQELQETVHRTFDTLREDTQKQLKLIERAKNKRELTAEEEKITRHLRRTLDLSEKLIEREVEETRTIARKQKRSE